MKKFYKNIVLALLVYLRICTIPIVFAQTTQPISPFIYTTPMPKVKLTVPTSAIQFQSLASSGNCIVTDISGNLSTATCGSGGSSSSSFGTTSLSALWPIIYTQSSSLAQFSFGGLSTTSAAVIGNIPYFSGVNTFANVATSTLSASSPLTGSFTYIGSGGSLGIQAASNSQNGYLSAAGFSLLNAASTTFSAPLVYTGSTNAVTCTNASSGVTGCLTGSDWITFNGKQNSLSYNPFTAASFVATSSATSTFSGGIYGLTIAAQAFNATSTTATSSLQNFFFTNGQGSSLSISGTVSAANFIDTALGGTTCVSETNGILGTSNCVASIASSGGTITVSSPTGAVNVDIALGHANTWTAAQLFSYSATTTHSGGIMAVGVGTPYINATSTTATSSLTNFSFTNGQGTSVSASAASFSTLCLVSDVCRTTWPTTPSGAGLIYNPFTAASFVATSTATSTFAGGLEDGKVIIAPYFSATSTTATSTFSGGVNIVGTLIANLDKSAVVASSTLAYDGLFGASGTTTLLINNPSHSITMTSFYCKTDTGTAWLGFGTGAATTSEANCSTSGVEITPASNNTWTYRQNELMEIGRSTGSPNFITITRTEK